MRAPVGPGRGARVWLGAALLLVVAVLPLVMTNRFLLHHACLMLMWATMAQAWNLLGGFAGQISFGHAAFFGTGAYVAGIGATRLSLDPWWGLVLAVPVAALLALGMGGVCFRLRGPYFSLATLALSQMLRVLATNLSGLTGGAQGLMVVPAWTSAVPFYYVGLGLAGLAYLVNRTFLHSRWGRFALAVRDDETAAEALAVPAARTKTIALILSGALTALAGGFYFCYFGYLEPSIAFSLSEVSIAVVLVVVLGGIATLSGPLLGAAAMVVLSEVFRRHLGQAHLLLLGLMVVLVIRFLPRGLVGLGSLFQPATGPATGPVADPPTSLAAAAGADLPSVRSTGATPPPSPLLRCHGLSRSFGGLQALSDFDLTVQAGEIVGIIGPNGAGKTTLFSLLTGQLRPSAGRVEFRGLRLEGCRPGLACRLGLVRTFQIPRPFARLTVLDNVVTAALAVLRDRPEARRRAWDSLAVTRLTPQAGLEARALTLAARKRLELARALATGPSLLLLDETAAGLTPSETQELVEIIGQLRRSGVSIVLVEHVLPVVLGLADRVVVLHHGRRLAEGPPDEVLRRPEVRLAYLGAGYP